MGEYGMEEWCSILADICIMYEEKETIHLSQVLRADFLPYMLISYPLEYIAKCNIQVITSRCGFPFNLKIDSDCHLSNHTKQKKKKKERNRQKRNDTYLTHVCRQLQSVESLEKIEEEQEL